MAKGIDWTQIKQAVYALGKRGCVVELAGASCNFIRSCATEMRSLQQTPVGFEIDPDSCPITDNHEMSVQELFDSINPTNLLRIGKVEGNIVRGFRTLDLWFERQGLDINNQKIFLILDSCNIKHIEDLLPQIWNLPLHKRKNLMVLFNTSFARQWDANVTAKKYAENTFRKPRLCSTQSYRGRTDKNITRVLSIWVEEDSSFFK